MTNSRHLTVVLVVLLAISAFMAGFLVHGAGIGARPLWASLIPPSLDTTIDTSVSLQPVQLIQDALRTVQREYVEPISPKDTEELSYSAIRGMLAHLNDPYTRFMDPQEFKEFNEDNAGRFAGIGATLNMTEIPPLKEKEPKQGTTAPVVCPVCGTTISDVKSYRVAIVEPLPNSPAKAAGLQPGDFILKIDDTSTDGMLVSDAANRIRGKEGTKVTLTIARHGVEKPIAVTITRAQIEVPAVESKMLDDKIGYVRLFSFNDKTVPETRAAILDLNKAGAQGLVLDLRSNPGGLLTECIKVATMFLPKSDKVIVSTKERTGGKESYDRLNDPQLFDEPMVVLVNKGSASASEILSGALKDHHRAQIIGESTFGKALVQTVIRLGDRDHQCAMAVTTAHYYTPSGYDLAKKGIPPDVTVALDKETKSLSENDNQAKSAIRILKDQMAKAK